VFYLQKVAPRVYPQCGVLVATGLSEEDDCVDYIVDGRMIRMNTELPTVVVASDGS
jgi:hypothetical protein